MKKYIGYLAVAVISSGLSIFLYWFTEEYPFSKYKWSGGSEEYIKELDKTVLAWGTDRGDTRKAKLLVILQNGDQTNSDKDFVKTVRSELERVNRSSFVFFTDCQIEPRSSTTSYKNGEIELEDGGVRLLINPKTKVVQCIEQPPET